MRPITEYLVNNHIHKAHNNVADLETLVCDTMKTYEKGDLKTAVEEGVDTQKVLSFQLGTKDYLDMIDIDGYKIHNKYFNGYVDVDEIAKKMKFNTTDDIINFMQDAFADILQHSEIESITLYEPVGMGHESFLAGFNNKEWKWINEAYRGMKNKTLEKLFETVLNNL